jgi:4-hydroxy-3-methylbut-2-en-1-yl diphosphate reductase
VRNEVVHNKFVVDELRAKGAIFVDDLDKIPAGNTVIFSAHGVSKAVRAEAEARGLTAFDATCPLVTKVHIEVAKMRKEGLEIIMIGHKGHPRGRRYRWGNPKAACILVETPEDVKNLTVKDAQKLAYVTQTTLSMDDAASHGNALKQTLSQHSSPPKVMTFATPRKTAKMRSKSWLKIVIW